MLIRPPLAKSGVRDIHDTVVQLLQPFVRKPEAGEHSRREVLGHRVGDGHELGEQLAAAIGAQVERDAQLLDVVVVEAGAAIEARPIVGEGLDTPKQVPASLPDRILDADDLSAERGEQAGRPRAGQLPRQVADANAGQSPVAAAVMSGGRWIARPSGLIHGGQPIPTGAAFRGPQTEVQPPRALGLARSEPTMDWTAAFPAELPNGTGPRGGGPG